MHVSLKVFGILQMYHAFESLAHFPIFLICKEIILLIFFFQQVEIITASCMQEAVAKQPFSVLKKTVQMNLSFKCLQHVKN